MTNCGLEHGKMCEAMEQREKETSALFTKVDEKVHWKLFMWIMGGMAVVLAGIVGYTHAVDKDMNKVSACVQVLESKTQTIVDTVQRMDHKLDRMNLNRHD